MGIFEFEPSLHELKGIGDKNNQGYVYKTFEELQVNQLIEWIKEISVYCSFTRILFHLEKKNLL